MNTDTEKLREVFKLREDLQVFLKIEFGQPSNSLAIANMKRLARLNELEAEAGATLSQIEGFRLVWPHKESV